MKTNKSISSGILSSSAIVLDEEGWLNGAILTSGSTDAMVTFYDSADGNVSGKLEIGYISKAVPSFDYLVHCKHGIYAEVENGAEFMCLFSK